MDHTVDTTSDPELVCSHAQCHVLAFLKSAHFTDRRDKNCTVGAGTNEQSLDIRIDIDVAILAPGNAHITILAVLMR